MKKSVFKYLPVAALALFFTACEDDGSGTGTGATEQEIAGYIIEAEAIASSVYNAVDGVMRDTTLMDGDTIQVDGANVSLTGNVITIDYGTGTVGSDGSTRSGSIAVTENGDYFMQGGSVSANFSNFKIDDKDVSGTIAVSNLGNDTLSMDVNNFDVDTLINYNATKRVHWISGFSTLDTDADDKFDLSGNATGVRPNTNNTATVGFTSPMRFDRSCQYTVVEGIIDLGFSGDDINTFDSGTVDFISSDGCNNQLILTITGAGGASLTLPRNFNGF